MSSANDFDYLIVGHGIAGASIAWHLYQQGKTFTIVDDSASPSSSRVAAGIFNPLTGRKLVKTWLADELFPFATSFYSEIQDFFKCNFLHFTSIYRPYRSIEEQNTYLAQSSESSIAPYIGSSHQAEKLSSYVNMHFGALEVVQSGWVDLPLLLDEMKVFFKHKGQYVDDKFDIDQLHIEKDFVGWKGVRYGRLILCQGFGALQNELFNWLPFTPVKGEILKCATHHSIEQYIINQGIFVLPSGKHSFKIGATYSWDPLDWEATDEGSNELEQKLKGLLTIPYLIEEKTAGIRPSVRDRRPLVGVHPEMSNVCIFNGLGTKGVTLAPYFAKQLVDHLENGKELNSLVNIKRYFSLYFR